MLSANLYPTVFFSVMLLAATIFTTQAATSARIQKQKIFDPFSMHQPSLADKAHCAALDPTTSVFCFADLPLQRSSFKIELELARQLCSWQNISTSAHMIRTHSTNSTRGPPSSTIGVWNFDENIQPDMLKRINAWDVRTILKRCDVLSDENSLFNWTFDVLGPFESFGGDMTTFLNFAFNDAGGFAQRIHSEIWVTGFAFAPIDSAGAFIGYPPIRIHHMHVSSSQSLYRTSIASHKLGELNKQGKLKIEFDVHGDRQCSTERGGTDCLGYNFPEGFGIEVVDQMSTFGSFNDVRLPSSTRLQLSFQHAYRWTRNYQRSVLKTGDEIGTQASFDGSWSKFGSELFAFDDSGQDHFLSWAERTFLYNATIVKVYYHSHETSVDDFWVVSASASQLQLDAPPYMRTAERFPTNLRRAGLTTKMAMLHVLSRLQDLQSHVCVENRPCRWQPRLRCVSNQDHWESLPIVSRPRYRLPTCYGDWHAREGYPFVFMTFHKQLEKPYRAQVKYAHTTVYMWAVAVKPTEHLKYDSAYYHDSSQTVYWK